MNALRVSTRARHSPGGKFSTLALLPLFCTSCAGHGPSRIYVLSAGHGCNVTTYSMDGKPMGSRTQLGGFDCAGIAVDAGGRTLVTMRGPHRGLVSITPEGKATKLVASEGASGVAVDAQGNIHLLVAKGIENWFVKAFTPDGRPMPGQLNIMLNNVSAIALDATGRTFVVSQGNRVVEGFDASGVQVMPPIRTGNTPRSVAVAPDGTIYVANMLSVTAYTQDGKSARAPLSHRNPRTLGLDTPTALAVDAQGRLYVGYETGYVGIINADGKAKGDAFMTQDDIRGIAVH